MEETVRVVDRVCDILELLSAAAAPMGVSEIARATGMSKATIHRLISSLCARRYVEKAAGGLYSIGYKMIEMASTRINNLELVTEAKPFLGDIMRELDLTAHLGILDGCDVVYVEKMDIYPDTRLYTQVGYRSPAYCSSIGKCLLSGLSGDELEDALALCDFKRYTANTIIDRREFKNHLKEVRRQGWAMDNEEYQIGHRCVGAPIFDYRGTPVAAISASGSVLRLSDERLDDVIREVTSAARNLSRRMGYIE